VSGCLIVCIDRATRLVKSQQGAGKEYIGVFKFHNKVRTVDLSLVERSTPPLHHAGRLGARGGPGARVDDGRALPTSAGHLGRQAPVARAHHLLEQAHRVQRRAQYGCVLGFETASIAAAQRSQPTAPFTPSAGISHVVCEAGTYVRTLYVHLGLALGVGGNMAELRRVRSGITDEEVRAPTVALP